MLHHLLQRDQTAGVVMHHRYLGFELYEVWPWDSSFSLSFVYSTQWRGVMHYYTINVSLIMYSISLNHCLIHVIISKFNDEP